MEKVKIDPAALADFCVQEAANKLADDVIAIKVGEQTSVADYFVLCSANSEPHLRAVTDNLERQVREKFALRPLSCCGDPASGWILIDFGTVIVHAMTPEVRARYGLESLWGDAPTREAVETVAQHSRH